MCCQQPRKCSATAHAASPNIRHLCFAPRRTRSRAGRAQRRSHTECDATQRTAMFPIHCRSLTGKRDELATIFCVPIAACCICDETCRPKHRGTVCRTTRDARHLRKSAAPTSAADSASAGGACARCRPTSQPHDREEAAPRAVFRGRVASARQRAGLGAHSTCRACMSTQRRSARRVVDGAARRSGEVLSRQGRNLSRHHDLLHRLGSQQRGPGVRYSQSQSCAAPTFDSWHRNHLEAQHRGREVCRRLCLQSARWSNLPHEDQGRGQRHDRGARLRWDPAIRPNPDLEAGRSSEHAPARAIGRE